MRRVALFVVLVLWAAPSTAQLVEPNQIGIRMGRMHLVVREWCTCIELTEGLAP